MEQGISFEEAATIRPDGGQNICQASIEGDRIRPEYYESMCSWTGPCWNVCGNLMLCQMDSEWSDSRIGSNYHMCAQNDLNLLQRWYQDAASLSQEDTAYLISRGYVEAMSQEGWYKGRCQCVWILGEAINQQLLSLGDQVRMELKKEMDLLKAPYVKAVMDTAPGHLRNMQKFVLQHVFYSDGWFILHCLKELVGSGRLKLPEEKQKRALSTVVVVKEQES